MPRAVLLTSMQKPDWPWTTTRSRNSSLPARKRMPLRPRVVPTVPWITILRSTTLSVAAALIITPLKPEFRIPPGLVPQSIVTDLVIVIAPNPPGSRQSISPPAAVFEIAPAKVLQGAVRLQGLASSPTPDTHVRVACACARDTKASVKITTANVFIANRNVFIWSLLLLLSLGRPQ